MPAATSAYRPDIDGLRALAVLAVVVFHAFPAVAPGGFVGVDVFFVISGFLITRIIVGGLQDGSFSFSGFYARRIRRVFPALALVLATAFAAGWFWLYADALQRLARHIAAGVLFLSNFMLWRESGYFDAAGDTKPLLHLWSLGIEEQFYLAWPLLMYGAWKCRISLAWVTAVLAGASFLLNLQIIHTDAVAAFYSPLTRVWELLVGALLVFVVPAPSPVAPAGWPRHSWLGSANLGSGVGLALIVLAMFALDRASIFPGWWALLPTAGAALVVSAGPTAWVNRELLSRPPMVWLGLISYPLYLWHWPLLSFSRIVMGDTPPALVRASLVLISGGLAWLTFRWLERPVRFGLNRGRAVPLLLSSMAVVLIACFVTERTSGFPGRALNRSSRAAFLQYYDHMRRRGIAEAYRADCDFMDWRTGETRPAIADSCTAAGTRPPWFLWGDSYAQALSLGLRALAPAGLVVDQVATSMCRPSLSVPGAAVNDERCRRANAFALERIAALRPSIVVLAQIEGHLDTDWAALGGRLRTLGVERVILVGPAPQWRPSLPEVITTHYWGTPVSKVALGLDLRQAETDRMLKERTARIPGLAYVSVIERLCDAAGCLAVLPNSAERELLAFDSGHLTPEGSRYVADELLRPILVAQR